MPPTYVKPYVKRQKNDAADAEAICEAVTRATMRFVETKTPEQQSWHCHGDFGLWPNWRSSSQGDEENQLQRVPLPS